MDQAVFARRYQIGVQADSIVEHRVYISQTVSELSSSPSHPHLLFQGQKRYGFGILSRFFAVEISDILLRVHIRSTQSNPQS